MYIDFLRNYIKNGFTKFLIYYVHVNYCDILMLYFLSVSFCDNQNFDKNQSNIEMQIFLLAFTIFTNSTRLEHYFLKLVITFQCI